MYSEELEYPPPEFLEMEAEKMPQKVALRDYIGAMEKLRDKGYSYREVADFMSTRLGLTITRSQVAYALIIPENYQDEDADIDHSSCPVLDPTPIVDPMAEDKNTNAVPVTAPSVKSKSSDIPPAAAPTAKAKHKPRKKCN